MGSQEVASILRTLPILRDAPEIVIQDLLPAISELQLAAGEPLFAEGDAGGCFYVVLEGSIEAWRASPQGEVSLRHMGPGEVAGELAFFEDAPRTANVRATEPTRLLRADARLLQDLLESRADPASRALFNIARQISARVRITSDRMVGALQAELESSRARADLGSLITFVIGLMIVYGFVLKGLVGLLPPGTSSTAVSGPLIVVLGVGIARVAYLSGRGSAFYGLTLDRWRSHAAEALLLTAPFLLALVALKLALVTFYAPMLGQPVLVPLSHLTPRFGLLFLIYCVLTPVQEFITRAVLQSSLMAFLSGPRAVLWAVLLSNGIFSFSHLHISLTFAVIAFLPGLFWGWMYARQRSLVGAGLSHMLIGGVALFALELGTALSARH